MAKDVPSWYHGGLTADEATKILTKFRRPGAYLLRDSQNVEGAFTLSCTVQESGNFVDVKHYRIVKVRLKKMGKKKFPTFKDIQNCLEKQAEERNELPRRLKIPIEQSMISEWDHTDGNWRENFKVHEGEKNSKQKEVLANPKDSKKQSRKFPRFVSSKKKQPNRNNNETELSTSTVDSNRENGMINNDTTEEINPSFTTNIKGQETLDLNIGLEKDEEDGANSYIAKEPTTTNATDAKLEDEGQSGSNDNRTKNVAGGIYMSPQGITTQNNIGLNQQADSNSITPTTTDTAKNTDAGSIGNNDKQKNTGIYMSTQEMGTENNAVSGSRQATEFTDSTCVPMSGRTFGNESRSSERGGSNAANQLQEKNSGIYMAPQQNANKDNPVPSSEEVGAEDKNETQ